MCEKCWLNHPSTSLLLQQVTPSYSAYVLWTPSPPSSGCDLVEASLTPPLRGSPPCSRKNKSNLFCKSKSMIRVLIYSLIHSTLITLTYIKPSVGISSVSNPTCIPNPIFRSASSFDPVVRNCWKGYRKPWINYVWR